MKAIRYILQILILVCCCLLTGCHHQKNDLYKRFSITYYKHGQLWSGILKEPTIVQSYPCIGRVRFDSAGMINHFRLSQDYEIRGHNIPENSIVEIYGRIMFINLFRPTEIQGYLIPGGEYINIPFRLDQNGNLIAFRPDQDIVIGGIPCMRLREVQLYPDGKLWVCFLAGEIEREGTIYPQGTMMLFDKKGTAQEYSYELYDEIRKDLGL